MPPLFWKTNSFPKNMGSPKVFADHAEECVGRGAQPTRSVRPPYMKDICDPFDGEGNVVVSQKPGLGFEIDWDSSRTTASDAAGSRGLFRRSGFLV